MAAVYLRKKLLRKVKKLVAQLLDLKYEEVKLDANFVEDFGADELDIIELIMTLGDEFGIEISSDESEKIQTVQFAVEYIQSKLEVT